MKLDQLYFASYYSTIGDVNLVVFVSKECWNKYKEWDKDEKYEEIQKLVESSFPNAFKLVHETIYKSTIRIPALRKQLLEAGLTERNDLV